MKLIDCTNTSVCAFELVEKIAPFEVPVIRCHTKPVMYDFVFDFFPLQSFLTDYLVELSKHQCHREFAVHVNDAEKHVLGSIGIVLA